MKKEQKLEPKPNSDSTADNSQVSPTCPKPIVMRSAFSEGDKVVMHTCHEATFPKYKGKIWTCKTDSYIDKAGQEVVFLEGFSGCFLCDYLAIVNVSVS